MRTTKSEALDAVAIAKDNLRFAEERLADIIAEEERAIRVTFRDGGPEYAYRMPEQSKMPERGQRLTVPAVEYSNGHRPESQLVTVVGVGRGDYVGELQLVDGWVVPL